MLEVAAIMRSEVCIEGKHSKPILLDYSYLPDHSPKPIIIFSHGFKGFKDWGHFNRVAEIVAEAGFIFIKFNFSHNGTTPEKPTEFTDIEAFGNNNHCIELDDMGSVIDWTLKPDVIPANEKDPSRLYLIGHSRGGAISILKTREDKRVKSISTWASISDIEPRIPKPEEYTKGVLYITNQRTHQAMPLYSQFTDNYYCNKERLDLPGAIRNMKIPYLAIHGSADESVPVEDLFRIRRYNKNVILKIIPETGHTFGVTHPFNDPDLPPPAKHALTDTLDFFKRQQE